MPHLLPLHPTKQIKFRFASWLSDSPTKSLFLGHCFISLLNLRLTEESRSFHRIGHADFDTCCLSKLCSNGGLPVHFRNSLRRRKDCLYESPHRPWTRYISNLTMDGLKRIDYMLANHPQLSGAKGRSQWAMHMNVTLNEKEMRTMLRMPTVFVLTNRLISPPLQLDHAITEKSTDKNTKVISNVNNVDGTKILLQFDQSVSNGRSIHLTR